MNFKAFTDSITQLLQEKMGEDCTITVTKVLKNNDISLTGVVIMEESDSISPTIYLEEPYRQYQGGASLEEIVEDITAVYDKHAHNINLDMDFFRGSGSGKRGEIVVRETIRLAKNLDMKVVAEGIEHKEQVEFLKQQGCDMIQGYYYAKPMPVSEFEQMAEHDF